VGAGSTSATVSVVIADDQADLRKVLGLALRMDGRFELVGEAASAAEAAELAGSLKPSIMVLDLGMPDKSGLDAIPDIRRSSPATKILVYSAWAAGRSADQAVALGADRYLEKQAGLREVVAALASLAGLEPG
jgi:DNA-binding NarL/FixJ family response regulator